MGELIRLQPHSVRREDRADGSILLQSTQALGPVAEKTGVWLRHWAEAAPDRVFVAERSGAGWREESFAATLGQVRAIAASLLARGLNSDTRILILSGNGVDHALLTLAAQYVGIPTVPVAEQYALIPGAHERLRHVVELVRPQMVYAIDGDQYANALDMDLLQGLDIVASRPGGSGATPFADLLKGDASSDIDAAYAAVGPDTVAKILMTSGSTSHPKGVLTTQAMMCANQSQIAGTLLFLNDRPPRIVDWLPWNHVFGGSHNFNMILANGGSLYIDDGKPVKGLFERSLENLSMITGTAAFNVPVGYAMLLEAMRKDADLAQRFFQDLDMVFYAGASLPQEVWAGFADMAMRIRGTTPLMTSSWGLTETAPAAMSQHERTDRSGIVGVPLPGVTIKLIPDQDMRCEVRVKGPNVMQGYFEDPEQSRAAFDDEGFFKTGDAMRFVNAADPNKGMRFDGRLSEDFKLTSGTWVRAAALRADLLSLLSPLAADLVITGRDRDKVGVMIVPNRDALLSAGFQDTSAGGAMTCDRLLAEIRQRLGAPDLQARGSSERVRRAIVLADPPSMAQGEVTAKGNLNFNRILTLRADILDRLYSDTDSAVVRV